MEEIILGGGCFWCIEAAYKELEGVKNVVSGYAGGHTKNPSYREVCSGKTGHAEVVKIQFDEDEISFEEVLEFFFRIHNPTTEDREGPDKGTQYRSIILYQDHEQKDTIQEFLEEKQGDYEVEIVTNVGELERFWKAEEKHQDYFEKNPDDAYCTMHAQPKVERAEDFKEN